MNVHQLARQQQQISLISSLLLLSAAIVASSQPAPNAASIQQQDNEAQTDTTAPKIDPDNADLCIQSADLAFRLNESWLAEPCQRTCRCVFVTEPQQPMLDLTIYPAVNLRSGSPKTEIRCGPPADPKCCGGQLAASATGKPQVGLQVVPMNGSSVEVNIMLPLFALGRRGRAELNYTSSPVAHAGGDEPLPADAQWTRRPSIRTLDGVFSSQLIKYYLNDLRPEQRYWFKLAVHFEEGLPQALQRPLESQMQSVVMPALVLAATTTTSSDDDDQQQQQQPNTEDLRTTTTQQEPAEQITTTTTTTPQPPTTVMAASTALPAVRRVLSLTPVRQHPKQQQARPQIVSTTTSGTPISTTTTTTVAPTLSSAALQTTESPTKTKTTTTTATATEVETTTAISDSTDKQQSSGKQIYVDVDNEQFFIKTDLLNNQQAPKMVASQTSTPAPCTTSSTNAPQQQSPSSSTTTTTTPTQQSFNELQNNNIDQQQQQHFDLAESRLPLPWIEQINVPLHRYAWHLLYAFSVMTLLFVIVSYLYLKKSVRVIAPITSVSSMHHFPYNTKHLPSSGFDNPSFTKLVSYYANQPPCFAVDESGQNFDNLARQKNLEVDKTSPLNSVSANNNDKQQKTTTHSISHESGGKQNLI